MSAPPVLKTGFVRQNTEVLLEARARINEVLDLRARQWSLFEDKSTANTAVQICTEWPCVLSASSLNEWMTCEARYWYRKMLGLPEKRTLALGLGTAVHEALAENFRQKIKTKRDLPVDGVKTVFRDSFEKQLDDVTLDEGDDIADMKHCGETMLAVYMDQAAPAIEPAAVELAVSGRIGEVPVSGFVDLLDVHGTIIDFKTSSKKPSGVPANHRLQVSTYAMLTPRASGVAQLHTLTKTKTVALHTQTIHVGDEDRRLTERLYSITLEQMRSGIVKPNRGCFLCSRKNCGFVDQCTADFGGTVD